VFVHISAVEKAGLSGEEIVVAREQCAVRMKSRQTALAEKLRVSFQQVQK
jgi:hypothetical protein